MAKTGFEGLLVPLIDLVLLGRRWLRLRLALARADLRHRASLVLVAVVLGLFALLLLGIMLVLLVQAGLLGLALLGLSPLQVLLAGSAALLVLALIFGLIARSCLRRATLPPPRLRGHRARSATRRP